MARSDDITSCNFFDVINTRPGRQLYCGYQLRRSGLEAKSSGQLAERLAFFDYLFAIFYLLFIFILSFYLLFVLILS